MLAKLAMMKLFGDVFALPASAKLGPRLAGDLGLTLLSGQGASPIWKALEALAPGKTVFDALQIIVDDVSSPTAEADFVNGVTPYRGFLLDLVPEKSRKLVTLGVDEFIKDPVAFSAYIEENLTGKDVANFVMTGLQPDQHYRCPECELPFISSKSEQELTCPHCEIS